MIRQLIPQGLDLVVGVIEHLSQFGNTVLEIRIILEEVADEVRDNVASILGGVQRLRRSGSLQSCGCSVQLLFHLALPLYAAHHLFVMLPFHISLFLDAL